MITHVSHVSYTDDLSTHFDRSLQVFISRPKGDVGISPSRHHTYVQTPLSFVGPFENKCKRGCVHLRYEGRAMYSRF